MPIAQPGDKVLVSGANGYIAIWVVRRLLEKGYSVVGQVRSADKGKYLLDYFKSYGDNLEIAVVPDITADGAFDEAVKGTNEIIHVASPVHTNVTDPYTDFIHPAMNGTVSVLKSALKIPTLRRVVVTSSIAAVCTADTSKAHTEDDWNDAAIKATEELGLGAGFNIYAAAKTHAEKGTFLPFSIPLKLAAWAFWKTHQKDISWDLSVVNPPFPCIHEMSSPDDINVTMKLWWDQVLTSGEKAEGMDHGSAWIDVRDIADAHVLAIETEAAGGERVVVSAGEFVWQDWVDIAPAGLEFNRKSTHTAGITGVFERRFDTSKEKKIYGMKLRTMEETLKDTLEDFVQRGW
ncbi:D-lactaldehyde dehydrogenase [Coprinopsis sp. MPI-PUGE-AT-0042]|nr:D-lactaldehyde dehydrogenase [Coprinopsis sp. MPI-PUGE-AT-0042]